MPASATDAATAPCPAPLWRLVAIRMAMVAVSVSLALAAFYFLRYTLDTPGLRRATLEAQARDIVAALHAGRDPAAWSGYRDFPDRYGFRVVDDRTRDHRHVVSAANQALLAVQRSTDSKDSDLRGGFESVAGRDERQTADRWLLTDRVQDGRKAYWIEAVMVGDPAGQWRGVILQEMLDQVVVPVLSVVALLTLAMFLTVRLALRPLGRIAEQANALAHAAASGGRLSALPATGLAREFREVVDALNLMLAKLDRSLRSQRQFTADAAHELRNPLAVLQLEAAQLTPQPAAQRVRAEIEELAALLDRLLQFAQAEDAMAADRGRVSLVTESRHICEELAPQAAMREQAFDERGTSAPLIGHAALIQSAVRNVIDNALKFSPPCSTITVAVEDGSRVVVDDEGAGIAPARRAQIFERFWRAPRGEGGGSGIGLTLARRIARLHGGDVTVTHSPSGGARFVLAFAPQASNERSGRQARISVGS